MRRAKKVAHGKLAVLDSAVRLFESIGYFQGIAPQIKTDVDTYRHLCKRAPDDFDATVRADRTFKAVGTPQSVCEDFFAYVAGKVRKRIAALVKSRGIGDYTVRLATVYPPRGGKEYVNELGRLACSPRSRICPPCGADGVPIVSHSLIPSSMYCSTRHRGDLRKNEYALVFDMGEESKIWGNRDLMCNIRRCVRKPPRLPCAVTARSDFLS